MKVRKILIIGCLFFALSLSACLKKNLDFDKMTTTEWTPEFAIPLVYASLDVYDILSEDTTEIIVIDEHSGQIALTYSGSLFSFNIRDIIALPELSFEYLFNLSAQEVADFIANGTITKSESFEYDLSGETDLKIESLVLEDGILELEIVSDFQHSGELTINIPGMSKDGQSFEITIPLDYTGSQIVVYESIDLSDYTIDMSSGAQGNNAFGIEYVFTAEYEGNPVTIADLIRIEHTFEKLEFLKLYGDIGMHTLLSATDTIQIDVFDNSLAGYFELVNPYVNFEIHNSFGLPIDIEIQTFQSKNLFTSDQTDIFFSGFDNPFGLNSPSMNEVGEDAITQLSINSQNSNFDVMLHSAPQQLVYELLAVSNPGSATSPVNLPNFVTNESHFRIDTEVILPLEGLAHSFVLVDTLDFEFGDNIEEIDSVGLRIVVDNGFPFNASLQVYFTDENFLVLDAVFPQSEDIILSGQVASDGIVNLPTRQITDVPFSQSRIPNITNASHVIIMAEMKTTNAFDGEIIKILDEYSIVVNMGLFLAGKVNL